MLASRLLRRSTSAADGAGALWRLHEQQQQRRQGWSGSSPQSPDPPSCVLVQREGGSRTALVGGAGAVQLERRFDAAGSGGGAAGLLPSLQRLREALAAQLAATFLPSGYPDSVAPGYLRNTLWQAAHHTAGSANGVLASTFLLYSVGLGAGAVPTAGALNWVLKDGLGQMGTLLFGKTIAHNFDVTPRAWYLLASAKLNLAMGLEICTFLLPHYFLPVGALANAIKGLSWMAGGSTKSVFKVSFAADNNFGDVSAKATSQTICASIVGTSAGVVLASQIDQSVGLALCCYAALAALHLYTGYLAVRCVPLATLNPSRLELLIGYHLQRQQQQQQQCGSDAAAAAAGSAPAAQGDEVPTAAAAPRRERQQAAAALPTPPQLAGEDPVFHKPAVCVGTPLRKLLQQHGSGLADLLQQQQQPQGAGPASQQAAAAQGPAPGAPAAPAGQTAAQQQQRQMHLLVPAGGRMHLLLHERAEAADCILGFLHACIVLRGGGNPVAQAARLRGGLAEARGLLPGLLAALEDAGWDDHKVVLEARRRRVTW